MTHPIKDLQHLDELVIQANLIALMIRGGAKLPDNVDVDVSLTRPNFQTHDLLKPIDLSSSPTHVTIRAGVDTFSTAASKSYHGVLSDFTNICLDHFDKYLVITPYPNFQLRLSNHPVFGTMREDVYTSILNFNRSIEKGKMVLQNWGHPWEAEHDESLHLSGFNNRISVKEDTKTSELIINSQKGLMLNLITERAVNHLDESVIECYVPSLKHYLAIRYEKGASDISQVSMLQLSLFPRFTQATYKPSASSAPLCETN